MQEERNYNIVTKDGVTKFYDLEWNEIPEPESYAQRIQNQAMGTLRRIRNSFLAETDWWCCSDRTPTQAQIDYRQALRDLPANSTPALDEDGNLTGVTWPTKPE